MSTRRDFIKMGTIATFTGLTYGSFVEVSALSDNGLFQIPSEILAGNVYSLSSDKFRPWINTGFKVWHQSTEKTHILKLVEVKDLVNKTDLGQVRKNKSFSLLFKGKAGTNLTQETYQISHKSLGTFSVLVVPVTQRENYYEVIFNKI